MEPLENDRGLSNEVAKRPQVSNFGRASYGLMRLWLATLSSFVFALGGRGAPKSSQEEFRLEIVWEDDITDVR